MEQPLLSVENLTSAYMEGRRPRVAVDGLSFAVGRGETVAVVGESGCGKTAAALSIARLIEHSGGKITGGRVCFDGEDLAAKSSREMRRINGKKIAMIFQEPMTSLNPLLTVGYQLTEVLKGRGGVPAERAGAAASPEIAERAGSAADAVECTGAELDVVECAGAAASAVSSVSARGRALEMLRAVGVDNAAACLKSYSFQLSGGQRQRVMIAMTLCRHPDLLIADEPTTALDVTIQAQILQLIRDLRDEMGMSVLLITHDLGIVAEMASKVIVMYAGQLVEQGSVTEIFDNPLHPYTRGLLKAVPKVSGGRRRLYVIPGVVPSSWDDVVGCRFHGRCDIGDEYCSKAPPPLLNIDGRQVRCHRAAPAACGNAVDNAIGGNAIDHNIAGGNATSYNAADHNTTGGNAVCQVRCHRVPEEGVGDGR